MKMRKFLAGILGATLLATSLSACVGSNDGGAPAVQGNESSGAGGKRVLKYAISSGEISSTEGITPLENMVKGFEEENDCEVEIVVIAHDGWSDYLTKLQTMVVSGNGPDVFQNPHEGGEMANALDLCLPLDDYIADHPEQWDEYVANAPEALVTAREKDGKTYGMPFIFQRTVMWMNLDRLEAAGLEVPDADWTWEEFEHYLEVLSQPAEDGSKQYAWAVPDYYFVYNQWLYSFGTGFLNDDYDEITFDSDASIELMQFCYDGVQKGYAPTPDKNYDYLQQLVDGHVAMTNAGRWMINYCKSNDFYNVAAVPIPQKYSDRQEYAIGTVEICPSTQDYDLAAAFCFYTTQKEWVESYSNQTANIPIRQDVVLTDELTQKGYQGMDLFEGLPSDAYPMQASKDFPEISNIFDRAFTSVMAGEATAEESCKTAAEEMRSAMNS